ncbi:MAG: hypothetical protein EOP07_07755 [Proteobacteria bacterium]|nr:MAG: hypothetical protein EOP07_07755 [Pseudomonadota bacterium]
MFYLRCSISLVLLMATQGYAQSVDERAKMIDSYTSYRKSGNSIYQPPPITHMVPNFNTITYALSYEKRDITMLPRLGNGDLDKDAQSSLSMKGYTLAPHLAISLKKVGIGFSIENSKNSSDYSYTNAYNPTFGSSQNTTVSTSGLGFNLSALPFEKLRKDNKLAVIIGGKSLNVRHEFTDIIPSNYTGNPQDPINIRYNLLKYEAGANLTLQLLKHFSVIPWVDYTYTDIRGAESAVEGKELNASLAQLYADDLRFYWKSYPNVRYGIDLGINAWGFDVRIGSFLGSLARLNAQPDYIEDKSFSISLSFDQKGG